MTDLSTHLESEVAAEKDVDEVFAAFREETPEEVAELDDESSPADVPDDFDEFLAGIDGLSGREATAEQSD